MSPLSEDLGVTIRGSIYVLLDVLQKYWRLAIVDSTVYAIRVLRFFGLFDTATRNNYHKTDNDGLYAASGDKSLRQ